MLSRDYPKRSPKMKFYEKLFAAITIPVGGFIFLFGLIGMFVSWNIYIESTFLLCIGMTIVGWSVCFTLTKLWRISKEHDNFKAASELKGDEYNLFIESHPEFIEADAVYRKRRFQAWKSEQTVNT